MARVPAAILAAFFRAFPGAFRRRRRTYPSRPISMIVPFPADGARDTVARFLAEQMRPILGQPIVIDNAAGAAGHPTGISFQ